MTTTNNLTDTLTKQFEQRIADLNGAAGLPVNQLRKTAMEKFVQTGFPAPKAEAWKYTNVRRFLPQDMKAAQAVSIAGTDLSKFYTPELKAHRLVFADGFLVPGLSQLLEEDGVKITGRKDAQSSLLEQHFGKQSSESDLPYTVLNTALSEDGAVIHVAKNAHLEYPMELIFVDGVGGENLITNAANLIVAESGSKAKIIARQVSLNGNTTWSNMVTEAVVAENASVDFYIIQDQNEQTVNVTNTLAHQSRDSRFATHTFTLGGKMVRNNLHFTLADENCEAYMNGLYLPSGNQHFDNQSFVDHAMPNCYSNELYKGIMMDQSTGVFNGKIMVREDAQKTNAFQSNKNILLSDDAVINTKPQLEIFADDVKCSHGATIGQLDEEALFYLRARGMGKEQAKAILTEAFAGEVLDSIEIESLKNLLEERVSQKLKQSTI